MTPCRRVLACAIGTAALACGRGGDARTADAGGSPPAAAIVPDPDPAGLVRSRTGVVFDPSAIAAGDTVAGLVVTAIDARPTPVDSTLVGRAAFAGTIQLDGATIVHHGHPEVQATCFEADSASADRLPRWEGDRRRAWFCMTNPADAATRLAPPGVVRKATIVIDSFTIHRGLSDETNTARLVRVTALQSPE